MISNCLQGSPDSVLLWLCLAGQHLVRIGPTWFSQWFTTTCSNGYRLFTKYYIDDPTNIFLLVLYGCTSNLVITLLVRANFLELIKH